MNVSVNYCITINLLQLTFIINISTKKVFIQIQDSVDTLNKHYDQIYLEHTENIN